MKPWSSLPSNDCGYCWLVGWYRTLVATCKTDPVISWIQCEDCPACLLWSRVADNISSGCSERGIMLDPFGGIKAQCKMTDSKYTSMRNKIRKTLALLSRYPWLLWGFPRGRLKHILQWEASFIFIVFLFIHCISSCLCSWLSFNIFIYELLMANKRINYYD